MTSEPLVTVICATCNAREAVRLTFASFRRHTPEPCVVLVGDNESVDGTLEELLAIPWITVFPLRERLVGVPADQHWKSRLHGGTLDWLAARVQTPYFLALDSDVEFLADGWLTELLNLAEREQVVAVGEFEPAIAGYGARLAPYVLLLRTAAFRALNRTFHGRITIYDPDEAKRFHSRPQTFRIDVSELAEYPSAKILTTAAQVLEELERTGARWRDTPAPIRAMYKHIGHMSWGANDEPLPGADRFRAEFLAGLEYVRGRLRLYEPML